VKLAIAGGVLLSSAVVAAAAALALRDHIRTPAATYPPPGRFRGIEEPPGIALPPFTLRSYDGRVVRSSDFSGMVVVVTFLDTKCREACPIVASVVGEAIAALRPDERERTIAIAITADPRDDTPATIRAFLRRRHALGRIDYLIGSVPTLHRVWRSFLVLSSLESGDADVHSAPVRIYGRDGIWLATEHVGVDLTVPNLVHDLRAALA
jgi:cytochrome oxidase Cu insertion factor (SCO1/SenC/PrrC family)